MQRQKYPTAARLLGTLTVRAARERERRRERTDASQLPDSGEIGKLRCCLKWTVTRLTVHSLLPRFCYVTADLNVDVGLWRQHYFAWLPCMAARVLRAVSHSEWWRR